MSASEAAPTCASSRRQAERLRFGLWALLALLIVSISPALSAPARPFVFRNVPLLGMGYVTGIAISHLPPYDAYIRCDVSGHYRYDRAAERWVPLFDWFGETGGESVAVSPTDPGTVYAAIKYPCAYSANAGEVLQSTDRGAHWRPTGLAGPDHPVYVGPNSEYRNWTGERLAVDPNKPDRLLFATSRDGLWMKDGTAPWARVTAGLPDPATLPGYAVFDKGKPKRDAKGNVVPNDNCPGFTFVLLDRRSGTPCRTLYVGVWGSGLWRSTDAGASFQRMEGSYAWAGRGAMAPDGTLYLVGGSHSSYLTPEGEKLPDAGAVWRCRDGVWTEITPAPNKGPYSTVTLNPANPSELMVAKSGFGPDGKIYRSTDAGATWTKCGKAFADEPAYFAALDDCHASGIAALAFDPANPRQVWFANGFGTALGQDAGANPITWRWKMNNLEELCVHRVVAPPKEGGADLLLAGCDMLGFRVARRTETPQEKISLANVPVLHASQYWWLKDKPGFPMPLADVASLTGMDFCHTRPDHGAAVGAHQWQVQENWVLPTPFYGKTSDNGRTWTAFPSVPTETYNGKEFRAVGGQIALSPTDPNRMVWVPSGRFQAFWVPPSYTTDGGATWRKCIQATPPAKPDPYDDNDPAKRHYDALPVSFGARLMHWTSGFPFLAADRADPSGLTFYYYDSFAFWYSTDGGATWKRSSTTNLPQWRVALVVAPNPARQGEVWLGYAPEPGDTARFKVYRSANRGETFAPVPGVDGGSFVAFGKGRDAATPAIYLYGRVGGAAADTLYQSLDDGANWMAISDPASNRFAITDLAADMRTEDLVYIATAGRGVLYGEPERHGE